ncbi:MAG: DUF971 domain-containing protein [Deltaproteobacteria bacterium]|nr:DUF971 domain-containing protein [Deltaproteobacteria bacterium]
MYQQVKSIERVEAGIRLHWQDGKSTDFSGTFLRKRCPCAVCRPTAGHGEPKPIPNLNYQIKAAHPVGWYALQFVFSDGHDTGIYTYDYLWELARGEGSLS